MSISAVVDVRRLTRRVFAAGPLCQRVAQLGTTRHGARLVAEVIGTCRGMSKYGSKDIRTGTTGPLLLYLY